MDLLPKKAGRDLNRTIPDCSGTRPASRQMIACPSRPAHNRDTERPGCGMGEATSGVRIVMRDNVSADRAEPDVNPLERRRITRWS